MKDIRTKASVIPYLISFDFFFEKLGFWTVKTNLWKPDRPVATIIVFPKENTWFKKIIYTTRVRHSFETCFFTIDFLNRADIEMSLSRPLKFQN